MKKRLPEIDIHPTMTPSAEERRLIAMKGQLHLEKLAVSTAGLKPEPLPKLHKKRPT